MEADKEKSKRILEEVKRNKHNQTIVNVDEDREKLVIFSLGDDRFAFEGEFVKEILLLSDITYVPGAAEHIMGVINVRGDIESVIAIDRLLSLPAPRKAIENRILIAEHGDIRSGILVERVEDVLDVPESSIKPPLSTMATSVADFIIGETDYKGRNVTVLDLKKIFGGFLSHDEN